MSKPASDSFLKAFTCLGFYASNSGGTEARGDCLFCGKEDHLYVNTTNGLFSCKYCGKASNLLGFMYQVVEQCRSDTTLADYRNLASLRGLSVRAMKRFRICFNRITGEWLVPCYSMTGTVRDIRRWSEKTPNFRSVPGCKLQLFGVPRLKETEAGPEKWLWLCEGEWDVMAMSEILHLAGRKGDVVLGVPGANVFKSEWSELFEGWNVRLCYDNDDAGDEGSQRAANALRGVAKKVEYLCWPDSRPKGYDIRDYFMDAYAKNVDQNLILKKLVKLFQPKHRRPDLRPSLGVVPSDRVKLGDLPKGVKLSTIVQEMRRVAKVDKEMLNTIRLSLAVALSEAIPGDPLWLYLVGAPGTGKTLVLNTLRQSERVIFRSQLTPNQLISGYSNGPDPSLFGKLTGKVLVCKDATEILTSPYCEEVWSLLRGAYDGHVSRSYGNMTERYYDNLHFSCLMGVTPLIYARPEGSLGERFLKYYVRQTPDNRQERIARAMDTALQVDRERDAEQRIGRLVAGFLERKIKVDQLPSVPRWIQDRVLALCQLVPSLRARVDRDRYTRELTHEPDQEIGTRLAKQLIKLGQSLALVSGSNTVKSYHYKLVRRVALDACNQMHLRLVGCYYSPQRSSNGVVRMGALDLANQTRLPLATVSSRVDDLTLLGVLCRTKGVGARGVGQRWWYKLSSGVASLIGRAGLESTLKMGQLPAEEVSPLE